MKEIKPLNDKILVKLLPDESVTAGGLVIPDTLKNNQTKGEVVALGSGVELSDGTMRPIPLNIGDKVLFSEGRGVSIKLEDSEDYIIISIKDILGIFN